MLSHDMGLHVPKHAYEIVYLECGLYYKTVTIFSTSPKEDVEKGFGVSNPNDTLISINLVKE